jgi:hypothetical protein
MSLKPYNGSFDALTGSIFASWFELSTKGPIAHAVGYAETPDRPWSLFYRWMCPAGSKAYVGAAVKEELSAASEDFGGVFFNFMIGLNNHLVGTCEQLLSEAPTFIRTNGNPQVDDGWLNTRPISSTSIGDGNDTCDTHTALTYLAQSLRSSTEPTSLT